MTMSAFVSAFNYAKEIAESIDKLTPSSFDFSSFLHDNDLPELINQRPDGTYSLDLTTEGLSHAYIHYVEDEVEPYYALTLEAETPKSHPHAMKLDMSKWTEAELKELKNHADAGTWIEIDRSDVPRDRRVVPSVWAFKIKRNGDYKARLNVGGHRHVAGVDFDQKFSSTLRPEEIRLIAAFAASRGLTLFRYDLVAAFLQGRLQEGEVCYIDLAPGYTRKGKDGKPRVCKVVRPMYGWALAGRRLQRDLTEWVVGWNDGFFKPCDYSPTLFHGECGDEFIILGFYVDDVLVLPSHPDGVLYGNFKNDFFTRWNATDEGVVTDFVNIDFEFRPDGAVTLHQRKYIEKIYETYLPDGLPSRLSSKRPTPVVKDVERAVADALSCSDPIDAELHRTFRSVIGSLLYLAMGTRPDIAFGVAYMARAMAKPTWELLDHAYGCLEYCKQTKHLGLTYTLGQLKLNGFTDSDWATVNSTSGRCFTLGSAIVSWNSKKQDCVALSTCEAEIVAASDAARELVWLRRLLDELKIYPADGPTPLGVDNKSARDLAYNPEMHKQTKHILRRHFFVRDMVEKMEIKVPYVPTDKNLADIFTKPLDPQTFERLRAAIMNIKPEYFV